MRELSRKSEVGSWKSAAPDSVGKPVSVEEKMKDELEMPKPKINKAVKKDNEIPERIPE